MMLMFNDVSSTQYSWCDCFLGPERTCRLLAVTVTCTKWGRCRQCLTPCSVGRDVRRRHSYVVNEANKETVLMDKIPCHLQWDIWKTMIHWCRVLFITSRMSPGITEEWCVASCSTHSSLHFFKSFTASFSFSPLTSLQPSKEQKPWNLPTYWPLRQPTASLLLRLTFPKYQPLQSSLLRPVGDSRILKKDNFSVIDPVKRFLETSWG